MKNFLLFLAFFGVTLAHGQFYYNDLQGAATIAEKMKSYAVNKVQSVTAAGFDPRGVKSTDFNEWQEVDQAKRTFKVTTRNGQEITRQYYSFDGQQRLLSIIDSTGGIKSTTTYQYDPANNITLIHTVVNDTANDFTQTEDHQWIYNTAAKPEKMWRIMNGKDSTEYRFTLDEKGNVGEEQLYRRGQGIESVYYYYDENNRLTDVARYNKKVKQILPDFMFEYDENNRVSQKIATLSILSPDYLIWRYIYNEKGLKTKDVLFNKDKTQTGRIEYTYQY